METVLNSVGTDRIRLDVTLSPEEVDSYIDLAYRELAACTGNDPDAIRELVSGKLKPVELNEFMRDFVMGTSGPIAMSAEEVAIFSEPEYDSKHKQPESGQPFVYSMTTYKFPVNELSNYDPIYIVVPQTVPAAELDDFKIDATATELAKRITGIVPNRFLDMTSKDLDEEFDLILEEEGRKRTDFLAEMDVNVHQLDQELKERARAKVRQGIALEAVFRHEGMQITDDDRRAVLTSMAPGHEDELEAQFAILGRSYVIDHEARCRKAGRLAMEQAIVQTPEQAQARADAEKAFKDYERAKKEAERASDKLGMIVGAPKKDEAAIQKAKDEVERTSAAAEAAKVIADQKAAIAAGEAVAPDVDVVEGEEAAGAADADAPAVDATDVDVPAADVADTEVPAADTPAASSTE